MVRESESTASTACVRAGVGLAVVVAVVLGGVGGAAGAASTVELTQIAEGEYLSEETTDEYAAEIGVGSAAIGGSIGAAVGAIGGPAGALGLGTAGAVAGYQLGLA
jgi:hypothetical protein